MDRLHDIAVALQNAHVLTALLPLVAKVTLIALIGRLLMIALPRASASTRYLIALTTFISMLVTPLVTISGLEWKVALLPPEPGVASQRTATESFAGESEPWKSFPEDKATSLKPISIQSDEIASAIPRPIAKTISFVDAVRSGWVGWLLLLAGAIAIGFLGRMLFGVAAIAWVTRGAREIEDDSLVRDFDQACEALGIGRFVRLLVSDRVNVPLMWGVQRPVLLLPAQSLEWTRDRLRVIFLHELAHLRRGDAITLLITRGATALYWFHPLAWSLDRAARRECEQACDDLVLTAGTRPSDYADHLLEIARTLPRHDPFGAVTLAMSRRSQLEGRLLSILHPHASRGSVSRRATVFAAIIAAVIVLPIAAIRVIAQPAPVTAQQITDTHTATKTDSEISVVTSKSEPSDNSDDSGDTNNDNNDNHKRGKDDSYWYERGREAYNDEHLVEAVDSYKKSIEAGYRPEASMYNIACVYSIENDKEQALAWLQKAIEAGFDDETTIENDDDLDPLRSDPRFKRIVARAIRTAGDSKVRESVEKYEALRARGSKDADEWKDAGTCLLQVRETSKAIDALNEAVRLEPFAAAAMYNLGCAYALQGDTQRALNAVEQAVRRGYSDSEKILRDPDLASIRGAKLNEIAQLSDDLELSGIGDHSRYRVSHYEEMVRKHPDIGRAWFNLGFARLESGDAQGGLAAFTKTLQMGHRPATTMYNLACSNAVAGNRDAAFDWLAKSEAAGFEVANQACHDDDLDNLRDDPRFAQYARKCWDFGSHKRKNDKKTE